MAAIAVTRDSPVRLVPVAIDKPWGREIWYSAIERRGESRVVVAGGGGREPAVGYELPLGEYLDAAGIPQPVILLKVLDPHPQPVRGDLYFEVHEHKREMYVVTAVDRRAWPDGRGRIRFGMNQELRRRFAGDDEFRAAYLAAVRAYEEIRRRIDGGEPVAEAEEVRKRAEMDAFTSLKSLHPGDVVVVPAWMPHALQHGTRVVEFQTAAYERYIVSFAQKVLTQDHWDSEHAIARLSLDAPGDPDFDDVAPGVERIASFDDFGVWRAAVGPDRPVSLPSQANHVLCMSLEGRIDVGGVVLGPEEACLIPGSGLDRHRITANGAARCLIAAPGL